MPRTIPANVETLIGERFMTLAVCWKIETLGGDTFAYTSHVRPLTFGGDTYLPRDGVSPSAMDASVGSGIDNLEAVALLSDDQITEADLMGGRFDGATATIYLVDYTDAATGQVTLYRGVWGDTQVGRVAFRADLRGIMQRANVSVGRVLSPLCDADLGDARCGYAGTMTYAGVAITSRTSDRVFRASSLVGAGHTDATFRNGKVTFTSGNNAGLEMEIKDFESDNGEISLQQAMPFTVQVGDVFTIKRGCDKRWITCKATYSNAVNFRGFPHIPGIDRLVRLPESQT